EQMGDWAGARKLHRLAVPIMTAARGGEGNDRSGLTKFELNTSNSTVAFRAAARTVYRADVGGIEARDEGFELAQWARQTEAADAVAQMTARFAKGEGPLADKVRE